MIKILLKVLAYLLKSLLLLLLGLIILLTLPYFKSEIYRFVEPQKFVGNKWFNPYENMDNLAWHKANFQVQSYAWKGVTDGEQNTNEAIDSIYSYLGYDIIATSDYMKINEFGKEKPSYLRVYEHGYNILKRHQIAIGANKVDWMDFMFFQSIHHKQKIINTLRPNNELIFLAHPDLSGSLDVEDFRKLTFYDGIEAQSIFGDANDCWDMALSTGHYVTVQCNDDSHNVFSRNLTGNYGTFINTKNFNADGILAAMKKGNAFGVRLFRERDETFEVKNNRHEQLAKLLKVEIVNDSLIVELDKAAKEIRFIGQGGEIKKEILNQALVSYKMQNEDTYIRTEFEFADSTLFYLNPIARTNDSKPLPLEISSVNWVKTWLFRLFILVLEGFLIFVFLYILKKVFRFKKA